MIAIQCLEDDILKQKKMYKLLDSILLIVRYCIKYIYCSYQPIAYSQYSIPDSSSLAIKFTATSPSVQASSSAASKQFKQKYLEL